MSTVNGMRSPMLYMISNVDSPAACMGSAPIDLTVNKMSTRPPSRNIGALTISGESGDASHAPIASVSPEISTSFASGITFRMDDSPGEYASSSSNVSSSDLTSKMYVTSDTGAGGSRSASIRVIESVTYSSLPVRMGGSVVM